MILYVGLTNQPVPESTPSIVVARSTESLSRPSRIRAVLRSEDPCRKFWTTHNDGNKWGFNGGLMGFNGGLMVV